jgi:hypothetical protein
MRLDKDSLKTLQESLPIGYGKILSKRLKEKLVLDLHPNYIYNILDPNDNSYNEVVIDEAILLASEEKKNIEDRKKLIKKLA